jgi:hypothetical protein
MGGQRLMTNLRPSIAIAGSGLAGLHCAVALSTAADVTVYERLPVAGGEHWDDPEHRRLVRRASDNGVRFAAGTQVVRWEGDHLLAIGEHGGLAGADALVVATGHRPPTRAELSIDGHRCAGVVPATLALHLLQQRIHLGSNVIIAGQSHWASECIDVLTAGRRPASSVLWLGADTRAPHPTVTMLPDVRITGTHGMPRITGVTVESASIPEHIACDCLILAGPPIAYRNIDGAVLDDDPAIYAQRSDEGRETSAHLGAAAAQRAMDHARTRHHTRVPVDTRIGRPQ